MPRAGHPSVLSLRVKDLIHKAKGKRPQSCHRLSRKLKNLGEAVFKCTIHLFLIEKLGLRAYRRQQIPRLTKLQKEKRLAFAKKYAKMTPRDWENCVFSDECPLYLFLTPNSQNNHINTDNRMEVPPSEQGTTINAEYYVKNILQPVVLPILTRRKKSGPVTARKMFNRRVEMVLGAPAHTARTTQQCVLSSFLAFCTKRNGHPTPWTY
ncbi:hypothetical protein D5F01_LYC21991 [Larimichthys crocea]|uniref:Transposase Tc1-like domain-containing protein n=1 Tax=Larimichthys crocea TaxID=215358 RepID=A0A6G0HL22_LARCR|nr:hypothetical protein D5F01_LYC21991 [Larimichthys crocea]